MLVVKSPRVIPPREEPCTDYMLELEMLEIPNLLHKRRLQSRSIRQISERTCRLTVDGQLTSGRQQTLCGLFSVNRLFTENDSWTLLL